MAVILVTYDLRKQGRNYSGVHEYLKKYVHCKPLESVWVLDTKRTTAQIRDDLKAIVDANDGIFVTRLVKDCAWINCGNISEWMNSPARTWEVSALA